MKGGEDSSGETQGDRENAEYEASFINEAGFPFSNELAGRGGGKGGGFVAPVQKKKNKR